MVKIIIYQDLLALHLVSLTLLYKFTNWPSDWMLNKTPCAGHFTPLTPTNARAVWRKKDNAGVWISSHILQQEKNQKLKGLISMCFMWNK